MPRFFVNGAHRLELTDRDDTCLVNGQPHRIGELSGALLKHLLRAHPAPLTRESIGAILSGCRRAPDGIGKAMFELKADLTALGLPPLAKVLRSRGFFIAPGWEVEQVAVNDSQMSEAVEQLRHLSAECANAVRFMTYVESTSGVQYVTAPPGLSVTNFTRFHESAWRLLLALSVLPEANTSLVLKLKGQLFELASYLAFWRMGTRHEEEEWKEEYRLELSAVMDTVEILAERIVEGNRRAGRSSAAADALPLPRAAGAAPLERVA